LLSVEKLNVYYGKSHVIHDLSFSVHHGESVALMGRNHPIGVVLAAVLFGFLFQGGAELGLWTKIPIELRTVVQGLVILFTGALDYMVRMMLVRVFALFRSPAPTKGAA